jgi:hypothetical protein
LAALAAMALRSLPATDFHQISRDICPGTVRGNFFGTAALTNASLPLIGEW